MSTHYKEIADRQITKNYEIFNQILKGKETDHKQKTKPFKNILQLIGTHLLSIAKDPQRGSYVDSSQ